MAIDRPIAHSRYTTPLGISARNRQLLAVLHARARGPFTAAEATDLLGLSVSRTRRLLSYLCGRGWLARIRRGLYTTVPLAASRPGEWREEPWLVACEVFRPGYIGGWSACEHWSLTDQIFRGVVVVTARKVRGREVEIQDTPFIIKVRAPYKLFGTSRVWLHGVSVEVSDASRTVVDILDDPKFGGGIRHVAGVVAAYFDGERRDDSLILEYARRLGNRAVFKRLGYLLETLAIRAPELLGACRAEKSKGLSFLDPTIDATGRIVRRWNLRVNATVEREEP